MREFLCDHMCDLSAEHFWELRYDLGFDLFCGEEFEQMSKSTLCAVHEQEERTESGVFVRRSTTTQYNESCPIPPLLKKLLGSMAGTADETLRTLTVREWCRKSSEPHMRIETQMPGPLAKLVRIESEHWVVPLSPTQCTQCTCVRITANVPMVSAMVEAELERLMCAGWAKLPEQCVAYVQSKRHAEFVQRGQQLVKQARLPSGWRTLADVVEGPQGVGILGVGFNTEQGASGNPTRPACLKDLLGPCLGALGRCLAQGSAASQVDAAAAPASMRHPRFKLPAVLRLAGQEAKKRVRDSYCKGVEALVETAEVSRTHVSGAWQHKLVDPLRSAAETGKINLARPLRTVSGGLLNAQRGITEAQKEMSSRAGRMIEPMRCRVKGSVQETAGRVQETFAEPIKRSVQSSTNIRGLDASCGAVSSTGVSAEGPVVSADDGGVRPSPHHALPQRRTKSFPSRHAQR